ncbi:MAG: glutathione S-transferase family protein [Pseudomonadota bacterium]
MDLVLYHFPGACSRVVMTALETIGVSYEDVVINIFKGEQKSPDYLKVHPDGKVPALAYDGQVITENVSIQLFLHGRFPEAGLLPALDNPVDHARTVSDLVWCGGTLHPIIRQVRMPIRFTDGDPSGVQAKGVEALHTVLTRLSPRFSDKEWWYGDAWSLVDVYFAWCCFIAGNGGFPIQDYPAIAAHQDRVNSIPSYARSLELEEAARQRHGITLPPPPS